MIPDDSQHFSIKLEQRDVVSISVVSSKSVTARMHVFEIKEHMSNNETVIIGKHINKIGSIQNNKHRRLGPTLTDVNRTRTTWIKFLGRNNKEISVDKVVRRMEAGSPKSKPFANPIGARMKHQKQVKQSS